MVGLLTPIGVIPPTASDFDAHVADLANPHATTKALVGLGDADNTSDVDKPISTATQAVVDALTASDIDNTPAGNIAATDVQAALNELDAEKTAFSDVLDWYIRGLVWSNNSATLVDISAGVCRSSVGKFALGAQTKDMDATWAAGDGNGLLALNATAFSNTGQTYHLFAILVGGAEEYGADSSVTGANLVTDHAATIIKRIDSMPPIQTASTIPLVITTELAGGGVQHDHQSPIRDYSTGSPGAAKIDLALSLPIGIVVETHVHVGYTENSTAYFWIRPVGSTDDTPNLSNYDIWVSSASENGNILASIMTDNLARVSIRSSVATITAVHMHTRGYIDQRVL